MEKQINALTSTRFFAAILVVIHHFGKTVTPFCYAPDFFDNGNLCVSYFFVLSGFILYYVNQGKEIGYKDFVSKRAARILPMYYTAFILQVLLLVYEAGTISGARGPIISSALLVQAFIPKYANLLNMPGWSLSVEAFFYVTFPLLLIWQRKSNKGFLWFAVLVYVASQLLMGYKYPYDEVAHPTMHQFLFFNPVMHINQFLIGMLSGHFYYQYRGKLKGQKILLYVVLAILFVCLAWRPYWISYQVGLLAPLFAILIMLLAAQDPKWLQNKTLVILGEASYSIYILHFPFYKWMYALNNGYLAEEFLFYIYAITLTLVSVLCYFAIERPMRRRITRWLLAPSR